MQPDASASWCLTENHVGNSVEVGSLNRRPSKNEVRQEKISKVPLPLWTFRIQDPYLREEPSMSKMYKLYLQEHFPEEYLTCMFKMA
jgi:hypothetical protein